MVSVAHCADLLCPLPSVSLSCPCRPTAWGFHESLSSRFPLPCQLQALRHLCLWKLRRKAARGLEKEQSSNCGQRAPARLGAEPQKGRSGDRGGVCRLHAHHISRVTLTRQSGFRGRSGRCPVKPHRAHAPRAAWQKVSATVPFTQSEASHLLPHFPDGSTEEATWQSGSKMLLRLSHLGLANSLYSHPRLLISGMVWAVGVQGPKGISKDRQQVSLTEVPWTVWTRGAGL